MNNQMDALTGVYNRTTLLSIFFRETDRAQRMNTPLALSFSTSTTSATGNTDWASLR